MDGASEEGEGARDRDGGARRFEAADGGGSSVEGPRSRGRRGGALGDARDGGGMRELVGAGSFRLEAWLGRGGGGMAIDLVSRACAVEGTGLAGLWMTARSLSGSSPGVSLVLSSLLLLSSIVNDGKGWLV